MMITLVGLIVSAVRLINNLDGMVEQGCVGETFEEERRNVLLTTILFGFAISIRFLMTLLATISILTLEALGEFDSV